MNAARQTVERLLDPTGIRINGPSAWDIQVHEQGWYARVLRQGSLGLGESYLEGWWDCGNLYECFFRILSARLDKTLKYTLKDLWQIALARSFNSQSRRRSLKVARMHYDAGNDIYSAMLDKRMIYSCAFWDKASSLDEAQQHKLDLICRKLKLTPGLRLLDIGCGWGGLARYAAEHYGVAVVGITISSEQARLATGLCKGMDVEIRELDYRDLEGSFDRVVSVGMFEHVGPRNYNHFMKIVLDHLTDDGLFLLHTIGGETEVQQTDPWIEKYIFPGSMLPSAVQIMKSIEQKFILEDWQNLGMNYSPTLIAWLENFERNWPSLQQKYGDSFYRMWKYYLSVSAASFRSRKNNVWQLVLSKAGNTNYYASVR
jgi:cyclopropane-fatty-acyl-phospholipid synthase